MSNKLPWSVDTKFPHIINNANGDMVASAHNQDDTSEDSAVAFSIIRAVNNHDKLVAALRNIVSRAEANDGECLINAIGSAADLLASLDSTP